MAARQQAAFTTFQGKAIVAKFREGELWYWRLQAANGEIVADGSEGYSTEAEARAAVARLKRIARVASIRKTIRR